MDNLKPCPFCGGKPEIDLDILIECPFCGGTMFKKGYSVEEAIAAWNKRIANEPTSPASEISSNN